jgi:similar to stage IV sporulation protein
MNDSQEVLRKEYVHADADIFISRQISYYQEFPLKYRTEIPAGKKKKEMYFRFGHWYLGLYPALHTGQKRITEEIPLRITENFILPVWIGWTETTDYTRKEAEKEAVRRFHQYEKKLLQNGIKISENHITIRLTESLCITGGTLLIIEQTGEKSRIT